MKWLVDGRYPEAEVIRVILDSLNPHGPGSRYEAFAPAAARRSAEELASPSPEARQSAEYGRDRVGHSATAMAESAHRC
ncbi:MAG TPA: hypothetical protein VNO70_23985 [Blastocatellia bacterium]|nr:hypothetical protein [Blastocatellia bacterium]